MDIEPLRAEYERLAKEVMTTKLDPDSAEYVALRKAKKAAFEIWYNAKDATTEPRPQTGLRELSLSHNKMRADIDAVVVKHEPAPQEAEPDPVPAPDAPPVVPATRPRRTNFGNRRAAG